MIIDTSALVAILTSEAERRALVEKIENAHSRRMSMASFVEVSMVIEARHGAEGVRDLDHLIARARIELVAVDYDQALVARSAFRRFGRGRHAAGLNYGACFSYALATVMDEPLLCKGDDFARTDVLLA